MKIISLAFMALIITFKAIAVNPQVENFSKRILLAHPTTGTIEVIYALNKEKLIDLTNIELVGIYHKDEVYDYSNSQTSLDTLPQLNMRLQAINDTLKIDSLFCNNACTPVFNQLFTESEGIIFFGGPDIPPAIYNEEAHPRTVVSDPFRHYFEASLIYHLIGGYQNNDYAALLEQNPDYLIFGICLGMQTMNVASGGTLIQDIPLEVFNSSETKGLEHLNQEEVHRNFYRKMPEYAQLDLAGSHFHTVIFKDYFFPSLTKVKPELKPLVNSYHHQAVEQLGKGFVIGATSSDGKIIEGMFHAHFTNVFGVQFHPERSQFFLKDKKVRFKPNGEKQFLSDYLNEESLIFHYQFWKGLNDIIQEL